MIVSVISLIVSVLSRATKPALVEKTRIAKTTRPITRKADQFYSASCDDLEAEGAAAVATAAVAMAAAGC
jgi:hypothetical protein